MHRLPCRLISQPEIEIHRSPSLAPRSAPLLFEGPLQLAVLLIDRSAAVAFAVEAVEMGCRPPISCSPPPAALHPPALATPSIASEEPNPAHHFRSRYRGRWRASASYSRILRQPSF